MSSRVGQEVTFHISESVVYQIRKPGESVPADKKDEPVIVRDASGKPAGTKTMQETRTVTIKAIDAKASAVTLQTEDGRTISMRVGEAKLMKDLKVGDSVVVTYTTAVAVSIE